jgi:hypothetical protein
MTGRLTTQIATRRPPARGWRARRATKAISITASKQTATSGPCRTSCSERTTEQRAPVKKSPSPSRAHIRTQPHRLCFRVKRSHHRAASTRSLIERSSHAGGVDATVGRDSNRTATPPASSDTRANTNAGVGPAFTRDVLLAKTGTDVSKLAYAQARVRSGSATPCSRGSAGTVTERQRQACAARRRTGGVALSAQREAPRQRRRDARWSSKRGFRNRASPALPHRHCSPAATICWIPLVSLVLSERERCRCSDARSLMRPAVDGRCPPWRACTHVPSGTPGLRQIGSLAARLSLVRGGPCGGVG